MPSLGDSLTVSSDKVRCGDCQHFVAGATRYGVGFCALTLQRQSQTTATGQPRPDRQGLPPDTRPASGYAVCFPMAPRICESYQRKAASS